MFLVQAYKIGCELIARAAVGITEDEEHFSSTVLFERDGLAMNIGQRERGRGRAGLQSLSLDLALTQRPLISKALPLLSIRSSFTRQGRHCLSTHGNRLRNAPLFIQQVRDGRAQVLEG